MASEPRAFQMSLQYGTCVAGMLKLNFSSGVGWPFEADHTDDPKLPWESLARLV